MKTIINSFKSYIFSRPYFFFNLAIILPIPVIGILFIFLALKQLLLVFLLNNIYYLLIFYIYNKLLKEKRSRNVRSPFRFLKRLHTTANKPQWDKYGKDCHHLIGVELGVWEGRNALNIYNNVNLIKLYLIDPWHPYDRNKDLFIDDSIEDNEKRYQTTRKKFLNNDKVKIIRKKSEDAAHDFEDESLDFVYVDGDHSYEYVKKDLELWYPKLKKFGVMMGDDYGHLCGHGVIKAVDEFSFEKKVVIHTLDDNQFWFIKSK